ncbi:MAG: VWA domain-containing protein [Bacteroidia bacterium]|nr:VWA domain-containing protein [Bacteroidia bacterium]
MQFANPHWIWALALLPLLLLYNWYKNRKKSNSFNYSATTYIKTLQGKGRTKWIYVPLIFRMIAFALLFIVMARPQSSLSWQDVTTEGIDIVIAQDISVSMLAQDFKPNRLDAAKKVAEAFIDGRPNDRIGLTIFAGEGFTQCPLTTDHAVLKNLLTEIKTGLLADGTAIGMGLATAVSRIKDSKAKSRVIILLTDGENNAGNIAPQTAAEIAKTFGIRVYTIGIGTKGRAYSPIGMYPNGQFAFDYVDVSIDEKLLNEIAEQTGGKYFRATNNKALQEVYQEIDKLEKSKIEVTEYRKHKEEFFPFLAAALIFLILEFLVKRIVLRNTF